MAQPLKNPFYALLVIASGLLLVTMFVYVVGWYYVPSPDHPVPDAPLPPWMRWIDRNALVLIACEVGAIVVLAILTISLDHYFEDKPDRK